MTRQVSMTYTLSQCLNNNCIIAIVRIVVLVLECVNIDNNVQKKQVVVVIVVVVVVTVDGDDRVVAIVCCVMCCYVFSGNATTSAELSVVAVSFANQLTAITIANPHEDHAMVILSNLDNYAGERLFFSLPFTSPFCDTIPSNVVRASGIFNNEIVTRFNKILTRLSSKANAQMASGQGNHWLIESRHSSVYFHR